MYRGPYEEGRPEILGRASAGGCLMGVLGCGAGAIWSGALGAPLWLGVVCAGVGMMLLGAFSAAVAGGVPGRAQAMGASCGGLLLLAMLVGVIVWIVRSIV